MDTVQYVIDQIPIRHNAVSYFIFLGVFTGILLSLVILFRTSKKATSFKVFGWSLLFQSLLAADVFLCYTGLMKYVPHLNDSTEPLVLLLAPSIYMFVYSLLERQTITLKKHWFHLLPAVGYFVTQVPYYLQSKAIKINAYLGAYHDHLDRIPIPNDITYPYLWIKDEFRWLILSSFLCYILLSIRLVLKHLYARKTTNAENIKLNKYNFSRNTIIGFLATFILIFIVFLNFEDDGGDHYIFIFHTVLVITTCFVLLSESRFFESSWIADKYETSGLTSHTLSIDDIRKYVEKEKFYISASASLKDLANSMGASANYISQIINTSTGLNFNDFINTYRVELSKKRLLDDRYKHLTIEAIGNSVGFKSRSAFYNAFKKHVHMSPKAFINDQNISISK
ncbi:helix-turn-helix domain-containing protein [Aquimarina sp. D1M17]|uniref:helix-turn-helix domain-containing protein n=1 Tax=Aquimarina acroporae TaxID=2937283 RepID=UPI0020C0553D|nr:helix-turn-helix domain-containing protein [Aquimarina acroporae]MCK8520915.1 helix-turn-helix domain-containing protein [Aquimarina acroporae]